MMTWKWDEQERYKRLPESTISALTETGQPETSIQVLKQRLHTSRNPITPSSLADTLCSELGVQGMFEYINTILGTTYTLNASISSLLQSFIDKNRDFGIAYAYLRRRWYGQGEPECLIDLATMKDKLRSWEAKDREMRRTVVRKGRIISRYIPPRRVWDLFSNRVVPWLVACHGSRSVLSHAWLDKKDRILVWTSINGKEWLVPLPAGVDLRLVRIELLELECKYVWLNVLCLRQEGGPREDLRLEEWTVDVPTIGGVYFPIPGLAAPERVVYYLNGLGRPLGQVVDMDSNRSWFRRAWTLQETNQDYSIAGETDAGPMQDYARERFEEQISRLKGILSSSIRLPGLLSEIQARVSTTVIDRVAGLAFLFWCEAIPTYSASQTEEEAWSTLLDAISGKYRAELFFFYPEPGDGPTRTWRPTWKQLMAGTRGFPPADLDPKHPMNECVDIDDDGDHHFGCHIKEAYIRGLGEFNTDHPAEVRKGKLTIRPRERTFDIAVTHHCLIPDGYYMIIGASHAYHWELKMKHWVVGKLRSNKFEKLSIFHIPDERDRKRLGRLDVAFVELATRRAEEDKIYLW
ncbi:hypothetical protein ARMSODRAFT_188705 [Armillaria solidipes]|uniref:Heterokaryon incompatibility domain-containing protein n=1 Tax=Armillaria solidipes TaxID=1076256 RepID=A0A2H3BCX2_9AGAR|nr:hypothetical protein ARMSODRAFT_188705 [Armillaria solidipes]